MDIVFKLGRKTLRVLKCVKFSSNINIARLGHCFTSAQVSMNILTSRLFQLYFGESSTWSVVLPSLSLCFNIQTFFLGVWVSAGQPIGRFCSVSLARNISLLLVD